MMKLICLLACLISVSSSQVRAEDPFPDMDIKVVRVTEAIQVFDCRYGKHRVNVTAFRGPDGVMLIDSGHKRSASALAEKLREYDADDIRYIINTHMHGDHTGGNETLGSEAVILAHENVKQRLLEGLPDSLKASVPGLPDSTFTDSLRLVFNGDSVRVLHLPHGHTDGDAIVHFVGANVACMGDLLFSDAIPLVFRSQGGSIDGILDNFDAVIEKFGEDVTVIPGHGRIYSMAEFKNYRDMLYGLTARVREEFGTGKSMDEVFASDVLAGWKDWVSQEFVSDSAFVLMIWDNDRKR